VPVVASLYASASTRVVCTLQVLGSRNGWKPSFTLDYNEIGSSAPDGAVLLSVKLRYVIIVCHTPRCLLHSQQKFYITVLTAVPTLAAFITQSRTIVLTHAFVYTCCHAMLCIHRCHRDTFIPEAEVQVTFTTTFKRNAEAAYDRDTSTDRNVGMAVYFKSKSNSQWQRAENSNAVWLPEDEVSVRVTLTAFYECALAASRPKARGLLWFKSTHVNFTKSAATDNNNNRAVVCSLSNIDLHVSHYHITTKAPETGSKSVAAADTITSDIYQCQIAPFDPAAKSRSSIFELKDLNKNTTTTINVFIAIEVKVDGVQTLQARAVHSEQLSCGEMLCICADRAQLNAL
jgi:hypothetical protein